MAEIIDGNTLDIVKENLAKLQEIYPEAFTEGKVDPQKLLVLLGEDIDVSNEKYSFTWKGKNDCIRLAQTPSKGTLLPCKEESVDWDNTQNLYIEGDNLEVLKLLQKSYLGKIDFIYIDPPYNTGSDFIYEDDFADNISNYKNITGQANKSNAESAGRYHTNWLNMIYPRLKIARTLLSDRGIIFLSIGSAELDNLIKIGDEIFGQNNRAGICSRQMKTGNNQGKYFAPNTDYIVVYVKNDNLALSLKDDMDEDLIKKVYNKVQDGGERDGQYYRTMGLFQSSLKHGGSRYPIVCPDGKKVITPNGLPWRWNEETFLKNKAKDEVVFIKTQTSPLIDYDTGEKAEWNIYTKIWLNERIEDGQLPSDLILKFENRHAAKELVSLDIPFDFPKPISLIKYLLHLCEQKDITVLDFFSGSATTAHAVMQLNAEDGGNRKFIMVQLPEICDEKTDAYKAGYKNICEIGKERIRRAGKLVKEQNSNVDTGFRVFKLDTSNLVKWNNAPTDDPNEVAKRINDSFFYLQPDRTDEDFVYEIMLKLGMPLSKNVEVSNIDDKKVYGVKDGAYSILICLEYNINFELVEKMAESEYDVLIFADRCFADANMLINTEEILKKKGKTLKLF